jgi:hypothetical protein
MKRLETIIAKVPPRLLPLQSQALQEGRECLQYFLDIVLERDIPIRQEYQFLEFLG